MYRMNAKPGVLAILMRHGKTQLNDPSKPKVRGWADVPLSPEGKIAAQMTANKIRFYNPKYIYHSDFMRDSETAHEVSRVLNIPAEADFDARTWDVGAYSGKSEDVANPPLIELYKRSWEVPPGSSESFNDFASRWINFLENKLDYAANVARPIVIVTHGRNTALTDSHINGKMPLDGYMPFPAGVGVIRVEDNGELTYNYPEETEPVIQDV